MQRSNKKLRCKLGFHKYEDVTTQRTKHICFGWAGAELPGMRLKRKCKYCGEIDYMKLTLFMPSKYLYQENLWKE